MRGRQLGIVALLLLLSAPTRAEDAWTGARVEFDRDIRPILSDKCFACHGPDEGERQSGLRLDLREAALQPADSGKPAIVPGKPEEGTLVRRISSRRAGYAMPPAESDKTLSEAEKATLRAWVAQGAEYRPHWSFEPIRGREPPTVADASWPRNPIDQFVLARLEAEGLAPAPEADRAILIRRLSLDLLGLPPAPEEVDAFLDDEAPDAYERLVDRLLASPHFGERMALDWLDSARFADTHGYHIDSGRDMTAWRAWVIDAFNRDLPFDRFTVEQLAGDLLPEPAVDQLIASGFNRNHMINFEGGAFPEEYRNAYIVDRVNTTGTVWLGLTVGCAQCHDHKFDPIAQADYYRFYAFFNNLPEKGLDGRTGNAEPLLKLPEPEQERELERLSAEIAEAESRLRGPLPMADFEQAQWEVAALAEGIQAGLPPAVLKSLKLDYTSRSKADRDALRAHFRSSLTGEGRRHAGLLKAKQDLEAQVPSTMVMREMAEPRATFILERGAYDAPGEPVTPGVPAFLPPLPSGGDSDRLALARWVIVPSQPLTARVIVNRYWQLVFGRGLVATAEDFGAQGERPSHPELLDWLASEFRGEGSGGPWDVKGILRRIVTSATYRQASTPTSEHLEIDPANRLRARAPRLRLPAELIRDQALAAAGLLDGRIGGRSVSPYQPAGLWEELASRMDNDRYTAQSYAQDHGRDLYRRTMYTFWKRTSPPPTLATFDAPDRETCTVRRARTNTPLQALILLNDPTYVEAARKLAERMLVEPGAGAGPDDRIALAFRLVAARRPRPAEVDVLRAMYRDLLAEYRRDGPAAEALLAVGETPRLGSLDPAELAAWTMVASAILNLDEAVNRG